MFNKGNDFNNIIAIFNKRPNAWAKILGNETYANIKGVALFYQTSFGVVVSTQVIGLPKETNNCNSPIFAYHIHSGNSCTGNNHDEFFDAGVHLNPNSCLHPYHMGDLPPLFGVDGKAFSSVLTNRFTIKDIIGKTIFIHNMVDDFTTQPAGNSGTKIACGEIKYFK